MRKLITGAVAASATLALTAGGVAVGQVSSPSGDIKLDVTAKPSNSGTKKRPKSVTLRFAMEVNRPLTTVETITVDLPKGLKFSGKGFKKCDFQELEANGPSACPRGSKAGPNGTAGARLEPGGTNLAFEITPFVEDKNTFAIYLRETTGLDLQTALRGELTRKGRRMAITIPQELRQPVPGIDATLTSLDQTFKGKRGKRAIVSSTRCKGKKWPVKGTLGFTERADGAPVPADESLTERVRCSK